VIENYFAGDLFARLKTGRQSIREFANERYSWSKVARLTMDVYTRLMNSP